MRIFICDDELQIAYEFEKIVRRFLPESKILVFHSGEELLKGMEQECCDLLLLDIDMPKMSGMDVAKRLGEMETKPLLVFVTSHDELVYDSFRYHPFGFVRKSFFEKEIEKVLNDCKEELKSNVRHFSFRSNGQDVRLLLSQILFFEADGNYLKVCAKDGEYRMRSTITAVENSLGTYGYIRVHKGFLVNQQSIRMFGSEEIRLENGVELPLGKTYMEAAKKIFMKYMR